jgi:glyoxylase-like metal-dependent hydrolase (beta-lactamase superfamily II)
MIVVENFGEITQIKMGRDLDGQVFYWVAAYLVDNLLIDTGCHHTAEELLAYLKDKPVKQAFITHYHEDHIGGCALLQQQLSLKLLAQPLTIELAGNPPALYPYQELVWGYPETANIEPLPGNELKTTNHTFQVINTPGHSLDHCVLIEPDYGWCFSGDLFISKKIKVLRPEENVSEIMQSLYKLLEYGLAADKELTLYTSIGKIVPKSSGEIKACLDYLKSIGLEAGRLHCEENLTEEQIVDRLFGGESAMSALTDGQFTGKNLVKSLLNK